MATYTDDQRKHLELVQGAINRIAQNSHTLKAIMATVFAVFTGFASTAENPSGWLMLAGLVPTFALWGMDANYVRINRMFTRIHAGIIAGTEASYNMTPDEHADEVASWFDVFWSWSVGYFYGAFAIAFVVAATYLWSSC